MESGQSAYQKIISGASLVQLYTGMIYQGPSIASKISEELINILDKEGVKNISDIVGSKNWSWLVTLEHLYNHKFYV